MTDDATPLASEQITQADCICGETECRLWLEHGYAHAAAAPKQAEQQGVEALRAALQPFVAHWQPWMDEVYDGVLNHADDAEMSCFARVTYGDLRRARAILAALNAPTGAVEKGEAK